jgi:hypothetical protein
MREWTKWAFGWGKTAHEPAQQGAGSTGGSGGTYPPKQRGQMAAIGTALGISHQAAREPFLIGMKATLKIFSL